MKYILRLNVIFYEKFVYILPFLMIIGILLTPVFFNMLSHKVFISILVILLAMGGWIAIRYVHVRYIISAGMIVCISMGIFAFKHIFVFPDAWQGPPQQVVLQGTLKTVRYAPHKTQLRLTQVKIDGKNVTGDVRINVKHMPYPYPNSVSLKAWLYPPADPMIPDAFDFRTFAKYNGIIAFGKGLGDITVIQSQHSEFAYDITKHIYTHMSDRIGGIAIALITANRVGMQADDVTALRGSGLAHLLAISGLHLGLVMGVVYVFVRALCCLIKPNFFSAYPVKLYASVISLIVALLYCIIADFPTPTVRAFLMGAIVVLGVLTHGKAFTIRSVSIVASIILLVSPESLFSASFQLSFIAVLGLVAVFSYIRIRRGWLAMLYHVCIASIVAMLVTLPFSAYHFGTVALYSVFANMVAVPLMASIIAPLLMVSVFEYLIFSTGYSLYLVEIVLTWLIDWAYVVYDIPHSVFYTGNIPVWLVFMFVIAMAGAIYTAYKKMFISVCVMILVVIFIYPVVPPDIIISRQGHVAVLHNNTYHILNKKSYYFTDAIRKQTGIYTFRYEKCKKQCVIYGVLYTKQEYVAPKMCDSPNVYRFIIAPKAILKTCSVPSFDKGDRILNRYQGIKIFGLVPSE